MFLNSYLYLHIYRNIFLNMYIIVIRFMDVLYINIAIYIDYYIILCNMYNIIIIVNKQLDILHKFKNNNYSNIVICYLFENAYKTSLDDINICKSIHMTTQILIYNIVYKIGIKQNILKKKENKFKSFINILMALICKCTMYVEQLIGYTCTKYSIHTSRCTTNNE